jgi:dolichyl-phosphate beta-glucosyltransferase
MKLCIIIPTYNEEKRILPTLISLSSYFSHKSYPNNGYSDKRPENHWEIVVVNDGSIDKTAEVVRDYQKNIPSLKLIDLPENHGKGYSVKTGMLASNGDYFLFMDADGSTPINQIEKMLPLVEDRSENGFDIVISSRHLQGSEIQKPQPFLRVFLGNIFRVVVSLIVPLGINDTQNGFKLFRKEAAKKIFTQQTIYRWAFDVEILAIARKLRYKIKEIPVVWINDDASKITLKGMLYMLVEVMKVRWNLWKNKYK